MKSELDILREVAEKLNSMGIPYMLTGSLAMSFYATPRMTRDIDIVIELDHVSSKLFIGGFRDGYYISEEAVKDSINNEFLFNIIHFESSIKIDFIIRKSSDYRKTEFQRRLINKIAGLDFYLVSKEDLIISKLFWFRDSGSETQKKDVQNLLNTGYDESYLLHWINKLNLTEEFLRVKND